MRDENELYDATYQLLLNGDVVQAVRLLSRNGKHNAAMIISQSASPQSSTKQYIKMHAVATKIDNNRDSAAAKFKRIVDLVTEKS
jgi:hypothetical protein